ncbi:TAXI family TRAP transporter solute-binding subunit [Bradyrhizobium diazoefficiens]|nr:TAXI family TRAP transporter solute-binding subunit [Bradyrhizobium diazoefficiens]MBR0965294.1 TAXI family TRAP transporter solute-binding subunit [Bradyrhizobium diazoefficiens]MBR0977691.1 TAXI family TRAP transporter solute-binding subunit [Bradyrhizobium diazoefficiens]MBR1007627.1 TAXI family TRAP transporter solute-binding subunit [Bradyrhizobium diazoefficiens]MBR1013756.1 TAXI family TRAP transporter solute-binding subunit [Bradyrhizobium diazoefficiens]MBR1050848.1 TAXI family TRA
MVLRSVWALSLLCAIAVGATASMAQDAPLTLKAAGNGSTFTPYAEGLAKFMLSKDIRIEVKRSSGSNENLTTVDESPTTLGTVFMGSAYDAVKGSGWAAGHEHRNVRALFPMYETSFQIAALRQRGISSLSDLDGKTVGVGPAKGPPEVFFRAAAEIAKIKPIIVTGDPAEQAQQVIDGKIDALWQGARVPIGPLATIADKADAVVFGLTEKEVAALLGVLPQLSPATVPSGSYKGQTTEIRSVSGWNFVVANKDLPDHVAYAITKAVLTASDPQSQIYSGADGTLARNAPYNRVVPFHPGALRFYKEAGIQIP